MALQLKFLICYNCGNNITFTDNTGQYNSSTNTSGFGTPNPELNQVVNSLLFITNLTTNVSYDAIQITPTDVEGTQTIIDITTFTVNGINQNLTSLPDGLYTYEWKVDVVAPDLIVYSQEIMKLSLCQIACKIKVLASRIDLGCGCCHDDCSKSVWKFLEAYTLYKALLFGGACGSISEINENIKCLQDFLRNINCQTC